MELTFSDVKVHNEIEFCSVTNIDIKNKIEHAFLENRISYFEKWESESFFKKLLHKEEPLSCTLCINSMQKDKANEIMDNLNIDKNDVTMILKRVENIYF